MLLDIVLLENYKINIVKKLKGKGYFLQILNLSYLKAKVIKFNSFFFKFRIYLLTFWLKIHQVNKTQQYSNIANRYSRQLIMPEIGVAGQQKLLNSSVLVVGAGGLGCPIIQYLVGAGVGRIGVVDYDVVETSNLQRQVAIK